MCLGGEKKGAESQKRGEKHRCGLGPSKGVGEQRDGVDPCNWEKQKHGRVLKQRDRMGS